MDENFLLHRRRALRLLELMEQHDKAWALYVFSSANVLRSYTIDQLVSLGISWVWMGLEGKDSQYTKLHGIDTFALVRRAAVARHPRAGLDDHRAGRPHAGEHRRGDRLRRPARHRLPPVHALHARSPARPLHAELTAQGRMKDESEFHAGDIHGQFIFNYRHPHIHDGQEAEFIVRAFQRDFEVNGPSMARIVRTTLAGWKRYKNHPDPRIRRRFAWESHGLGHHVLRGHLGDEAVLSQDSGHAGEDVPAPGRSVPGVRLEVAALCGVGRTLSAVEDPAGGKAARPRLDLRAAHVLREERKRGSSAFPRFAARRSVPLRDSSPRCRTRRCTTLDYALRGATLSWSMTRRTPAMLETILTIALRCDSYRIAPERVTVACRTTAVSDPPPPRTSRLVMDFISSLSDTLPSPNMVHPFE